MKKGFTLVELLAVIVILAVILVIAVPQISNVIKESRVNAVNSTAKMIARTAESKSIENEVTGNNGELDCRDLVKLDNNYGSCSVSIVNGKGTVTLNGASGTKFEGITCTGTKSNMNCTEGNEVFPEYVYAFPEEKMPFYDYLYTVLSDKKDECKDYLLYNVYGYNEGDSISSFTNEEVTNICSNSNDVYANSYVNYSTSMYFIDNIKDNYFTYDDVSSFVERSPQKNKLYYGETDYTKLKNSKNETPLVFIRWPGNSVNFDINNNPEICTSIRGNINSNLNCFKYDDYDNEVIHLNEYADSCSDITMLGVDDGAGVSCSLNSNRIGFSLNWSLYNGIMDRTLDAAVYEQNSACSITTSHNVKISCNVCANC